MVIIPEGTFILNGTITGPGPVNIGMATVAVLGGPLNQVTADRFGFYELFGVLGTLTLRVSKPGYRDETRTLTVTEDQTFDVRIRPISATICVAGTYGVTLTISPSCSIVPNDQKTRTYTATIGQDMARVNVQLGDAKFVVVSGGEKNSFTGSVLGSTVTFDWGEGELLLLLLQRLSRSRDSAGRSDSRHLGQAGCPGRANPLRQSRWRVQSSCRQQS